MARRDVIVYQDNVPRKKSVSLAFRLSLWLILAATAPLLIVLVSNEVQTRATLINQADKTLQTDAQTHAQLIQNYLTGKMLEARTLDNTPVVQQYFTDHDQAALQTVLQNGLAINKSNDPDIVLTTHFTLQGQYLFHYSIYGFKPEPIGKSLLPPEDLQAVLHSKTGQYVSDVYDDPEAKQSVIDIYTVVFSPTLKPLGIIRSTLSMNYIWSIINSEKGANGSGSYAFILDENGIRIVDPDQQQLFTSVAPLSSQAQQLIISEQRYGTQDGASVVPDSVLAGMLSNQQSPAVFSETPAGANEAYQVAWQRFSNVPWTYFVLTPQSSIYVVANQQLLTTLLVALLVLIPAALLGWMVGNNIAYPISRSVESLLSSNRMLNQLSENEKKTASEQLWMIDASEAGLKSIQYYTNASRKAASQLNMVGTELLARPERDKQLILNGIGQMVEIGQYFGQAVTHQEECNRKVAAAMKATNEIARQIESSAQSVNGATSVLDEVVNQLRKVAGS